MEGVWTFLSVFTGHGTAMVVAHLILVAGLVLLLAKFASQSMKAVPTGAQNFMEAFLEGAISMGKDTIGEELARKYLLLVATVGLFVLISNLVGIIPGFESPTSNINVTLPLALFVFVYYNYEGIRVNGVKKYFAHFMGPVPVLAPLMFPIEIVSHISRIISLSFRLFGNIKGDDLFLWVLLMLVPYFAPLPAYLLLSFSALLQTFVFMILIYVYLAGAVAIDDDHQVVFKTKISMKLSSPLLSFLVNFLLGASWAFALMGATILFYLFINVGIMYGLFAALIGAIPGLFLVLLIEYVFMKQEAVEELKKQTKYLEELANKE